MGVHFSKDTETAATQLVKFLDAAQVTKEKAEQYISLFRRKEIRIDILGEYSAKELEELGVASGDAKRIRKHKNTLRHMSEEDVRLRQCSPTKGAKEEKEEPRSPERKPEKLQTISPIEELEEIKDLSEMAKELQQDEFNVSSLSPIRRKRSHTAIKDIWNPGAKEKKNVYQILFRRYRKNPQMNEEFAKIQAKADAQRATSVEETKNLLRPAFFVGEGKTVPVRVYISSLEINSAWRRLYVELAKFSAPFPVVHIGIQICNMRLDWYADGLVHARGALINKTVLEHPTVIIDPSEGTQELPKTEEIFKKICEFIVRWNTTVEYNDRHKNCQHFVNELLTVLGFESTESKIEDKTALGRYLRYLRDFPSEADKKFLFRADGSRVDFPTHDFLDYWHEKYSKSLDHDEEQLIKAFHRAFQCEDARKDNIPVEKLPLCIAGRFTTSSKAHHGEPLYSGM